MQNQLTLIPYGYCHCGCGGLTSITPLTIRARGYVKGTPRRYINGHATRRTDPEYIVDPKTGCWNWARLINDTGYGITMIDYRTVQAHRMMYERHVGPIPKGLQIDHLCRNPPCVNPAHLEPVTPAENQRRRIDLKLSLEGARDVRRRIAAGETQMSIAADLGVSSALISNINTGKLWREDS